MTRNVQRRVSHELYMLLLSWARSDTPQGELVPWGRAKQLKGVADVMTERISPQYDGFNGAGAMWLAKEIRKAKYDSLASPAPLLCSLFGELDRE